MTAVVIRQSLNYARVVSVGILVALLAGNPTSTHLVARTSPPPSARPAFASLPVMFEPNRGQADPSVGFLAHGIDYSLSIASSSATLVLESHDRSSSALQPRARTDAADPLVIRMQLVGARGDAPRGIRPLETRLSYFRGNDPDQWLRDVPVFGAVQVDDVYEGIDVVYYGHEQELEYDFRIAPGARPSDIRLRFEGASDLDIDATGDLLVRARGEVIRQHRPVVYQELDGNRREVEARYQLTANEDVTFEIGPYDQRHPLIIDPILSYASYLGGSLSDTASDVAVDADGFITSSARPRQSTPDRSSVSTRVLMPG